MAKDDVLSCLAKRDLLNQPAVSLEVLLSWAQRFVDSEMFHDAVDFYEKAGANDDLLKLLELAQNEGDLFLFKRINRFLGREPGQEEWSSLATRAQQLGKETFAAEAFHRAGREEPGESPSEES